MQASKIIAGVLSVCIVSGVAYAVTKSGDSMAASMRESVCANKLLGIDDQDSCATQMKAAKTEVAKQQVATRFQSKIDTIEATNAAAGSASSSSSGGVNATSPSSTATPSDATSGSLNQPNAAISATGAAKGATMSPNSVTAPASK